MLRILCMCCSTGDSPVAMVKLVPKDGRKEFNSFDAYKCPECGTIITVEGEWKPEEASDVCDRIHLVKKRCKECKQARDVGSSGLCLECLEKKMKKVSDRYSETFKAL